MPSLIERIRANLPTREELAQQPWLAPIADRVLDRKLWTAQHESSSNFERYSFEIGTTKYGFV